MLRKKGKDRKFKANLRILENANELINSIACDSSAAGELAKRWGDKPTARCKSQAGAGFTRTQSFLLRRNDNVR